MSTDANEQLEANGQLVHPAVVALARRVLVSCQCKLGY